MNNKDNNEIKVDSTPEDTNVEIIQPHDEDGVSETSEAKPLQQGGTKLAGIGLFVALLALLTAGWLVYRVEVQGDDSNAVDHLASKADQQDLDQLQTRVKQLEQALTKQTQSVEQNQQQISKLQREFENRPDNQFDATGLEQQISTLQQQLKALTLQYREQAIEPQTDEHLTVLARAQTINALKIVQLLIAQQQIPEAVNVLKQWRNNEHLPLATQTRLQQLVTTLSNVQAPNLEALRQQLSSVKNKVAALSLTTEIQEREQPAWYERFITVKKIKPEQQDLNSVDLQQLKANATYSIQQAELGLTLKQPSVWNNALKQAEQTLSKTSLNAGDITQTLQQLSEQHILIQVPKDLGINALIRQLEGLSE